MTMRILFIIVLGILSIVKAASPNGNRLLLLLEESIEDTRYSKYIADLKGKRSFVR